MLKRVVLKFLPLIWFFSTSYSYGSTVHFVTENLPPFQFSKNGELAGGAMVELVDALIKHTGIEATIDSYAWARAYSYAIHQPNTVIFSIRRTASRENLFVWLGHLYTLKTQIAVLKRRTDIKLNKLKDVNNYSIGAVRGDYDQLLIQNLGIDEKMYLGVTYKELWMMLKLGRIDSLMTNPQTAKMVMADLKIDKSEIVFPFEFNHSEDHLYIAANKQTDPIILDKLRLGLITLKKNGIYQKILEKWELIP